MVAAGLADRCEVQLAYAIGVARPLSINVETFGTGQIADDKIATLIDEHFDLRPGAIIRDLDLRRPIYRQTAAYGHFGRTDVDLPWEDTIRAEALRSAAGGSVLGRIESDEGDRWVALFVLIRKANSACIRCQYLKIMINCIGYKKGSALQKTGLAGQPC